MSGLGLCGWIALLFGVVAYNAAGESGWLVRANLAFGALALATATARAIARARGAAAPAYRASIARGLLGLLAVAAGGLALERLASAWNGTLDWSFGHRFQISDATRRALEEVGSARATLFVDPDDPRVRSTRMLLAALAETGHLTFEEKRLDDSPELADRFGVEGSNSIVVEVGSGYRTIARPTEGTLFEALYRLRERDLGLLLVARGAGEGDLSRSDVVGFSGLGQALQTEGYRLRELVTASGSAIPDDITGLLVLGPQRRWRDEALQALDAYLEGGGRLVAFLEPGAKSGVEDVLARWGMSSPDAFVIDPASGAISGEAPGRNPIAFGYVEHAVTRGLDPARMTFFHGVRAFEVRKPQPDDLLTGVVQSSGRAWLEPTSAAPPPDRPLTPPSGASGDYRILVAAGKYERAGKEARIVAFGDSELASNHYLRTLYNLDLVLNAVHWATSHDPEITIRPKASVSGRLQLALPIQNTFTMFQGVGLLLPELLLMAAAITWARARNA